MPNRKKKHNAVVGVFETKAQAERAVTELKAAGFDDSDIGMVYRNTEGKTVKTGVAAETYAEEGAAIGTIAGAAGGALATAGIIAGVIPAIGPVLALGTLGTLLVNAASTAAVVGIGGALIGWGIPEEDASYYENEVKAGRFLVTVDTSDRADEARAILHRHSGFDRHTWAAVRADRSNILAEGGLRTEDGRVIQLREEQLRAHKEVDRKGAVKVRKEVHTEHKKIDVPVEREEIVIERRPGSGRRAAGAIGTEEIRIPVKEERVRVSKEAVVTEEVNVGKRKVRGTQSVGGDVRKEKLVVESEGGAKVRQSGNGRRR